ncbi:SusC/RagA family TonB-linked outer membrane protein [Phaeocystidibacter marisrubri]|uniref:TonB-dependent receptor n=1 Tax=Phaeocystidibacter marisrubri TaxID=1577780 RepID=A0A6L3ZCW5_9FLAO|nr:TonB-dependent receptor [Phaeocystidibacter marisrubri]KAB2815068.1 TonB-dependent receptor [Phaeocystidibacter marisrubri]GGH70129.1 TonB-dependent receptor SusC [Phaeocystidibacter marisrubri]
MKQLYSAVLAVFFSLLATPLVAQTISGVVTDETNETLPSVAVVVQGTSVAVTSDFDGKYTITGLQPGDYVLEFQVLGYGKKEMPVTLAAGQNLTLNVQLNPETSELDEVVIVGYGVQRKRDVTGSIVKLDSRQLTDMPAPSFETAMQGKAPGVQVVTGSGIAGSGSVVRVRGIASISAGGDPLYVVDGIPITQDYFLKGNSGGMNNNPLASLNPEDIESIEILKDAAATAIYGSRGSNGVILITTKRGANTRPGEMVYEFNARIGVSQPTALPNMLNNEEYLQMFEEAWYNDQALYLTNPELFSSAPPAGSPVLPGGISLEDARKTNTNWVDEVTRLGIKQQYDFAVGQNEEQYNYRVGLTYDNNQSYLTKNDYSRLGVRANGDVNLSKRVRLGVTTSIMQGLNNRVDEGWSGGLGAAMSTALPIYPVYNPDGSYWSGGNNPVRLRELKDWQQRELRSINSLSLTYKATDALTFTATGSYDFMQLVEDIYEPQELLGSTHSGTAQRYPLQVRNWNMNATGTYMFSAADGHDFTVLLGTEFQERRQKNGNYFNPADSTYTNSVIDADGSFRSNPELLNDLELTYDNNPGSGNTFASFFGRVNYTIHDKYLLQGVVRTDASSNFGPENRWGVFPSLGAGWILSEESFLRNSKALSFLKLKMSYGISGNAAIPDNQWRATYGQNGSYNGEPITYQTIRENPTLKWEESNIFDAGLEFGFLNDRITGELAYYYKYTTDALLQVSLPRYQGFDTYWDNLGEILNTGVEFNITARPVVTNNFSWKIDFNIAYNYNEITSIGGYSEDAVSGGTNDTRVVVGAPVGTNFLVRYAGIDASNGRPMYYDKEGNITYDWTPDDRVAVGKVLPDAIGGITNSFRYHNWDLSFLFVYSIGGQVYDSSSKRQLGVVTDWNMRTEIYDRWTGPGDDDAAYPRLTRDPEVYGSNTPWINTDLWLHDADYIRLRNFTIGYNLPKATVEKWGLDRFRVSFIATNVFLITNYPGLDPEIARDFENATDRNMSVNVMFLTPPQERTFSLALNVNF